MGKLKRLATDLGEQKVLSDINEYGWHCMNVVEDDGHPPWSFTIGLYETWQHPELIVIGRSRATSHEMVKTLSSKIEDGCAPDLSHADGHLLLGMKCHFLEVNARYFSDYVGFALWYYRGKRFPLYQIVWPNHESLYPWDEQASKPFKEWQPVLGRH
jgi:hypothetical protein